MMSCRCSIAPLPRIRARPDGRFRAMRPLLREWANGRAASRASPLADARGLAQKTPMDVDQLLGRPERWASVLGWATLAGIEFGVIGPFGSYASHLSTRLTYWIALFWVGSLLLWPCVVAGLMLGPRRGFPPLFSSVAVVLVACVPLAALGAAGTWLFWPGRAAGMHLLEWYGLTIVVALPAMMGLLWLELGRKAGARSLFRLGPARRTVTALPDHLLANALCLQMEDHHVRVHLHGRSSLHFGVMRDVVAGLDPRRGLQVHRSWWVARSAVRRWHQDGRSVTLELVNGLIVPVARNRVALLRAEGWLDEDEALRA
ncbi:LytTR family transcriptional regulator [Rhizorhabdus dicambivorans]|nr:LytTR family transcriptional regulator [Rhizorhabdus dicambivorans]